MSYNDTDINIEHHQEVAYIRQQNRILSQWNREHNDTDLEVIATEFISNNGQFKFESLPEKSNEFEYGPEFNDLINEDIQNFIVEHEDIVKLIRQLNKAIKFKDDMKFNQFNDALNLALNKAKITNPDYIDKLFEKVITESENYYDAVYRMKQRVYFMFSFSGGAPVTFGTLTFSDECLESTSPETRRRYVSRYLSQYSACYLANIDYGKQNEREHYHFIAVGNFTSGTWSHGFDFYKLVRSRDSDVSRTSKYIRKLINHAKKETAGKLIYSRNIPKIIKTESGYCLNTETGSLKKGVTKNDEKE